jgi:hypothetical protein
LKNFALRSVGYDNKPIVFELPLDTIIAIFAPLSTPGGRRTILLKSN